MLMNHYRTPYLITARWLSKQIDQFVVVQLHHVCLNLNCKLAPGKQHQDKISQCVFVFY